LYISPLKIEENAEDEFFTTMKILFVSFWVLTPRSDVIGYQRFRGFCRFHLHPEDGGRKQRYPTTSLHGVQTQKTTT